MIRYDLDVLHVIDRLKLATMPAKQRTRFLWRLGDGLKKATARNVRTQRTPDGQPWTPRKRKPRKGGKKKMLTGLPALLAIDNTAIDMTLRFRKGSMPVHAGVVAGTHNDGMNQRRTADQASRNKPKREPETATKAQAKRLRLLGYKRRGKRGKYVNASTKWIQENLSYRQAGMLIKKLKDEPVKRSWDIELPARQFMGANEAERAKIIRRVMQGIGYGWNVKKQQTKGASS